MACYDGFGNLADQRHRIWVGGFGALGGQQILFYYEVDSNWWLGTVVNGQLTWELVGNTAGFGNLNDGRPIWTGYFSNLNRAEILFYFPGDHNWWLGTFSGNQLTWSLVGNTSGFGNLADGAHPTWVDDFNADGRSDILFYYQGDHNWWLGSISAGQLVWRNAGNTAGFGNLNDGRPIWTGYFRGVFKADVLFYFPGDRNWWLGTYDGARLVWTLVGNTAGFGQIWDGRPVWTANFRLRSGGTDVMFYYPGDRNWWLGSIIQGQLEWSLVGNTTGFGQVWDGRPFWIDDFNRDGQADVVFYYPGDRNWWLGSMSGPALAWSNAGNTAGFGQIRDGRPFWSGDFNRDGKAEMLFYNPKDGNWWMGTHDGTRFSWTLVGNTGRPYSGFLRMHLKILTNPSIAVATMVQRMREIYATADIRIDIMSTENLTAQVLGAATFTTLNDLDVGACQGAASNEQVQLFGNQNGVAAGQRNNEVVVYFVNSVTRTGPTPGSTGALNGCASFPGGQPGAVIASIASQWTLAHEVGHVMGLNHIQGEHTGCPASDPECCSTPNFTRLMTGCSTSNITGTPTFSQDEMNGLMGNRLTHRC